MNFPFQNQGISWNAENIQMLFIVLAKRRLLTRARAVNALLAQMFDISQLPLCWLVLVFHRNILPLFY
jgi:hypothetical protein